MNPKAVVASLILAMPCAPASGNTTITKKCKHPEAQPGNEGLQTYSTQGQEQIAATVGQCRKYANQGKCLDQRNCLLPALAKQQQHCIARPPCIDRLLPAKREGSAHQSPCRMQLASFSGSCAESTNNGKSTRLSGESNSVAWHSCYIVSQRIRSHGCGIGSSSDQELVDLH